MGRIAESERMRVVNTHVGHWTEADALSGGPLEIDRDYGLAQLQVQGDEYQAKTTEVQKLAETTLPALRAERDALFGGSDDESGVWFRLNQYKPLVRARLGRRHPLSQTIPNVGTVTPSTYLTIIHNFAEHWERVNAALETPLTVGTFAVENLKTRYDDMNAKTKEIAAAELSLSVARAEREELFGDVPEDDREPTSIIARLALYHAVIESRFPNQPIARTLPRIFPVVASSPTFAFNWRAVDGEVKTWLRDPALANAIAAYVKEGAVERTQPYPRPTPTGAVVALSWDNLTVADELDAIELHDAAGRTLATGRREAALPEPEAGV